MICIRQSAVIASHSLSFQENASKDLFANSIHLSLQSEIKLPSAPALNVPLAALSRPLLMSFKVTKYIVLKIGRAHV